MTRMNDDEVFKEPTAEELQEWAEKLKTMSYRELCNLWDELPFGHFVFNTGYDLYKLYQEMHRKRFLEEQPK